MEHDILWQPTQYEVYGNSVVAAKCSCDKWYFKIGHTDIERAVSRANNAYIDHLQAELAKFHECEDSNGCYNRKGESHTPNGFMLYHPDPMSKVYHKEGE